MQPSANWAGLQVHNDGLNTRTGASAISDNDFTLYPPFTELDSGQQMGETTNMFWLYDLGTFPLNSLIDDWSICYTAVDNPDLSLSNIGVFTLDIDNPTYTTDNTDYNGIMFYNSCGYRRIYNNIPSNPYGTPRLLDSYRFYCPPYNGSKYVWTPNADGAVSSQGYLVFYPQCNVEGYAAPYKTFGIKSMFLEIRVVPYRAGNIPLPLQDYSLKAYMALTDAEKESNPICYAYARVWRRGNTNGTYTYYGAGYYDINAAITVPFSGNGYSDIGAYFNNIFIKDENAELYFPLFGNASGKRSNGIVRYNKQDNTADIFYGYNRIDNRIQVSDSWLERQYTFTMAGTEENAEFLRKSCAAYGLFFCDDVQTDDEHDLATSDMENTRWTHDEMMLGIIEDDGYTRGNYTHGLINANQPQFDWVNSTDSTYNPDVPPTPTENEYSHATVFNTIGDLATLTKRYVLNDSGIQLLGTELFKVTDDIFTQYSSILDYVPKINSSFLTNNPLDCIVSLQKYPIEIPKAATSENIRLGSIQTDAIGYKFDAPCLTFLFGGKKIFPRFGNSFLDYNPFTRFEIYVPFCGTVDLNPADILGRVLNVELIVDMSTGTCTGYIESDNLVIETVNGNVAIDIPVSGIDAATVNANLNNAAVNARTAFNNKRANSGLMSVSNNVGIMDVLQPWKWGGKATSMVASSLNSGYAAQKANYDLMHTQAPVHVIGSVSPVGAWAIDLNCRVLAYYPTGSIFDLDGDGLPVFSTNKLSQFGALQGFATAETGNLNQYKGLTIAVEPRYSNMHTNSTTNPRALSADELDLITAALSEGIINNIS